MCQSVKGGGNWCGQVREIPDKREGPIREPEGLCDSTHTHLCMQIELMAQILQRGGSGEKTGLKENARGTDHANRKKQSA